MIGNQSRGAGDVTTKIALFLLRWDRDDGHHKVRPITLPNQVLTVSFPLAISTWTTSTNNISF
jgi:hypothetical protein